MKLHRVRIWDLPTRLFHWALALCILGSVVSVKTGEMQWHFRFGYAILTLLVFRLIWGFTGPLHARFASFPPRLRTAWRSLRGQQPHRAGHSPAGALSVYALLLVSAFQAASGLFSNDGIMWDGPLRKLVSGSTSDFITGLHQSNRIVLLALIALHVLAIVWYRLRRGQRLTSAMITGDQQLSAPAEASRDDPAMRLRALLVLALAGALVAALVR